MPHAWQLRGAVAAIEASTVRVRHKSGQIVALTIDSQTAFVRNKQPVSLDALNVGTRVMVDVLRDGSGDRAKRVEVFGGTRTARN